MCQDQKALHVRHFRILVIICAKYRKNITRTSDVTEQTQQDVPYFSSFNAGNILIFYSFPIPGCIIVTNFCTCHDSSAVSPDNKVHEANMGPTWVLSAQGEPHLGPMNLAIRVVSDMTGLLCMVGQTYPIPIVAWYFHVLQIPFQHNGSVNTRHTVKPLI